MDEPHHGLHVGGLRDGPASLAGARTWRRPARAPARARMPAPCPARPAHASAAPVGAQTWHWGLLPVWAVIKLLTVGRLIGNAWRLRSAQSPLRDAPEAAAA